MITDLYNEAVNAAIQIIDKPDPTRPETCRPQLHTAFNAESWSEFENLEKYTNCYAYALGRPDMGWAVPGHLMSDNTALFNALPLRVTVDDMRKNLERDGLIPISEDEALSGRVHAIAMVIAEDDDYHFFRRDADGTWSEKNVSEPPRQRPDIIIPSRDAKTALHTTFAGYFSVPDHGVKYTPRLHVPSNVMKKF